ncbi:MAG: CRISPR-associated endoribonuclease Cas6, partial [Candidatus Aenigmatarchaeota archaeon]
PVKAHTTPKGIVLDDQRVNWYVDVSIEETIRHLIIGMFEKQEFFIQHPEERFVVRNVELLPEPAFCQKMAFRVLSPVTVAQPVTAEGKLRARYLMPGDQELSEALRKNILERYSALYGSVPDDTTFIVTPDWKYIEKRGGVQKVSKLITIKESTREETKVRGFVCPLTIEGNPALIKLAYESGLGEKGSMGFGMIEVVSQTTSTDNRNIAETL